MEEPLREASPLLTDDPLRLVDGKVQAFLTQGVGKALFQLSKTRHLYFTTLNRDDGRGSALMFKYAKPFYR